MIDYALVIDERGELLKLTHNELELDYRNSIIQQQHYVVLEAAFTLTPGKQEDIQEKMDDLTERRESKQPLEYPSCGSVFRRPPGHFAVNSFKMPTCKGIVSVAWKSLVNMLDLW